MDRSWMFLTDRFSQAYVDGVDSFIEFAKAHSGETVKIKCPCRNCCNFYENEFDTVKAHLLVRGVMVSYTTWLLHGEIPQTDEQGDSEGENGDDGDDDYEQLMEDHYKGTYMDGDTIEREDVRNFEQLLEAAQRSFYPGCNDTLLSFVIEMLQVKVEHGWSNTSFDKFLSRIRRFLPEGHVAPQSIRECKKLLRDLGLGYELIEACPKDCVLFWKEYAHLDKCPKCGRSRYKVNDGKGKKIPHKILRYLPLTPRLQRLYMNSEIAEGMRWHSDKRVDDDQMRHPADAPQWKEFDRMYPEFSQETRNVKYMGPGTKKKGSSTQVLRKSQRIQEGGGSPNGSTSGLPTKRTSNDVEGMPVIVAQPSELPTSPLNETNQLSSPCNVVAGLGSTSIPSKKRGPTRGINVDKLRKKLGHPIPIEIDREIMAIVGDHATAIANALGESIRAHAPVRDIGWCKVEFGIRESIVLRVGQTFELGDYKNDKVLRRIVDVKCQSLYANWKTKLFKRYKKLKKKHEKKRGADPKTLPLYPCNPNDWVFMIDNVWWTDDWKKKSKRGKKARKGLKYNHTSGSQSFVARASMHVKDGKKSKQSFPERFKETHIRHRMGTDVWIDDKAKKHHDEIVNMIDEQKQPDVTNPLSEEQISVEVLGKRSGYLKGYGIHMSTYGAQSQGAPNSEVVALKQQVANQEQLLANQGKVLADYGNKLEKMMLMLATGVDPAAILGLIQSSENGESTSGGQQNGTPTS